jgi:hypothetical protein
MKAIMEYGLFPQRYVSKATDDATSNLSWKFYCSSTVTCCVLLRGLLVCINTILPLTPLPLPQLHSHPHPHPYTHTPLLSSSHPPYHIPGKIAYLFLLYLSPNSLLYLFSFFHAHSPICPTANPINTTVLRLQFTIATPNHASASNM